MVSVLNFYSTLVLDLFLVVWSDPDAEPTKQVWIRPDPDPQHCLFNYYSNIDI